MFDVPAYFDNLDDVELSLWVAAMLADVADNQG